MKIGPYQFDTPVILAPMAGITDLPFRNLCYQMGADLCISEMVTSQKHLWHTKKTRLRLNHENEAGIRSVQIAGTDPMQLAEAARFNAGLGARIIDINMGCPAKKVCNVQAGSALMRDEKRVAEILEQVVNAVNIPVTLKMRTGWDSSNKNAVSIAKIAEDSGIQAIAVHGRTRADGYRGEAEYETIARVKSAVTIPVIANGDITTAEKASQVLSATNADAVMIGRGAQGNPWIFSQVKQHMQDGTRAQPPETAEICATINQHLQQLYTFYGEISGVRIARKHIGWYIKNLYKYDAHKVEHFRKYINKIDDASLQLELVTGFINQQQSQMATQAA